MGARVLGNPVEAFTVELEVQPLGCAPCIHCNSVDEGQLVIGPTEGGVLSLVLAEVPLSTHGGSLCLQAQSAVWKVGKPSLWQVRRAPGEAPFFVILKGVPLEGQLLRSSSGGRSMQDLAEFWPVPPKDDRVWEIWGDPHSHHLGYPINHEGYLSAWIHLHVPVHVAKLYWLQSLPGTRHPLHHSLATAGVQ